MNAVTGETMLHRPIGGRTRRAARRVRAAGAMVSLLALLATAACNGRQGAATAVTSSAVVSSTSRSAVTVPGMDSADDSTDGRHVVTTTTTSAPTAPPVTWTLSPAPGSVDISPIAPISLVVAQGTLQSVTLTNAEGKVVSGALADDGLSWTASEVLGYGRDYTVAAVATDELGASATQNYTFATLTPDNKTLATAFPTDGMTVGVGQPIAIFFDEAITDKAAVEKLISVSPSVPLEGAFYWLSNREVHWRPKTYWPANIQVDVTISIYGHDVGNGIYGQQDKHFAFSTGPSKIALVDDSTHTMTVIFDGVVVKQIPVSLGRDKYPTFNGVHVVAEKYESKIMDSSTWGLVGVGAYKTEVKYATRISSSGEFVHAAPWSVDYQGYDDVSHGCVNVSTANAIWFYENFGYGDIVDISGTVGPPLAVWDGYGDWQVPWETYAQGGKG